jgi:hypothetical protein
VQGLGLSFGSETGRTRSGTKGFSNKAKKLKRKKQEYHTRRRARFQEVEQLDPAQARVRATLALDRLGHQVISTEPGGYDLEAWTRNVDVLLDDFQEKVGQDRVGAEFREASREAIRQLVRPSTREVDSEIEALREEEQAAKTSLAELTKKMAAKLASLREERAVCERDLKAERERLADLKEARQKTSFLSRFVRTGPSTQPAEQKVAALEAKLKDIDDQIDEYVEKKKRSARAGDASSQRDSVAASDGEATPSSSPSSPSLSPSSSSSSPDDIHQRLEVIYDRLVELQSLKQSMLQLTKEREIAAKKIADMMSSLDLGPPPEANGELGNERENERESEPVSE